MTYGATDFRINGTTLRSFGYNIAVVDGWDEFPSWRGGAVGVAYRHGAFTIPRRWANPRQIGLGITVLPFDPASGQQVLSPEVHLQQNLDTVFGLLYSTTNLTIDRIMPDGTTRQITGEVVSNIPVRGGRGQRKSVAIQVACEYPFWHETPIVNDNGNSGTFTVTTTGNAPVGDAVFTFTGVAKLTNDDDGSFIEITSGSNTIVDCGARTVTRAAADVDNDFNHNEAWWMELQPGVNNFTLTGAGTVDIDYYNAYL